MDETMYDILKLSLMNQLSSEISEPLADLIKSKSIKIEDIKIDSVSNELTITLESDTVKDVKAFKAVDEAINNILYNSFSEFIYK